MAEIPKIGADPGDYVTASAIRLTASPTVMPPSMGSDALVSGLLTAHYVPGSEQWRFSVNGRSVDPATIRKQA